MNRKALRTALRPTIAALALYASVVSGAESKGQQELLMFLSASAGQQFDVSSQEHVDAEDFFPTADFLYAYNRDRFRFLGEYLWTSEEHDLERLQIGWRAGDETMLWLGRFHQPGTVWNTTYHHGQYMQTSITRPVFEQWEDDGGFLPAHSTGLMLQSGHGLNGQGALEYALSIGTGQIFNGTELVPFDLVDPEADDYELAYAFQLAYLPASLGNDKLGVLGDHNIIEVEDRGATGLSQIVETKLGIYADWSWGRWRVLPTVYRVEARLEGPGPDQTDSFYAIYVQAEYAFDQRWTAYARAEEVTDTDSAYLELFPEVVSNRQVLGLRWDLAAKHALTLEFTETDERSADFGEVRLQWSTVLP